MDELQAAIHEAAGQARMIMRRLADEGGLLHQIESGEWDHRFRIGSTEIRDLLDAMGERARLDRIILEKFSPED